MSKTRAGRYCIRGHDTFLVGRDKSDECKECRRLRDQRRDPERRRALRRKGGRSGPPKQRFCNRGHDTFVMGRDANSNCNECRGHRNGLPGSPRPEWERARVERWLEIVREDPLDISLKSTQLRGREFQTRYERLEADVPTPDDETVDA
jgi:hypothetical protein